MEELLVMAKEEVDILVGVDMETDKERASTDKKKMDADEEHMNPYMEGMDMDPDKYRQVTQPRSGRLEG